MKRMQMVAAATALAVVALAASAAGASASSPTWFECVKAEKVGKEHNGNYNDKLCSSPNTEGKGKYELREGVDRAKPLKGKGGPAVLHVKTFAGDAKVECGASKSYAIPAMPNRLAEINVTFKRCDLLGNKKEKCTSEGRKRGEIRLHAMRGEVGYLEESPPVLGVHLEQLEGEPEGVIASFTCGEDALSATVTGQLVGVQEGDVNVFSKVSQITFQTGEYLGEVEYDGLKFAPLVNLIGLAAEREGIEHGEAPPQVLKATLCGLLVYEQIGSECAPSAYAGIDETIVLKSEGRMIKT